MPRDGSGTYTLPAGVNPVVAGTVIDVLWANPTLGDVATALTDSLSRTGSGGMLAPFLNADGAIGAPGIAWVNEVAMGIYRPNANEMRFVTAGVDQVRTVVDANNPLQVWVDSDSSFRTVLNIFSPYTIVGDWTWEGRLVTDDSTTVRAGLNVPLGVAPTSPVDGDIWLTAGNLFARVNGATVGLGGSNIVAASTAINNVLVGDAIGGWVENAALRITPAGGIDSDSTGSFDGSLTTRGSLGVGDGVDVISMNMAAGLISTFGTGGVVGWSWNVDHFFDADVKLLEHPSAPFDSAGYGSLWVENLVPNTLMYTDDAGTDMRVSTVQWFNKMGDQQTINNTSVFVNVTSLSGFILEADSVYHIEIQLRCNQASSIPDMKLRLNRQGAGTFTNEFFQITNIAGTGIFTFQDMNVHTVLGVIQNAVGNHMVRIEGLVDVGTGDTWDLQFAQNFNTVANTIIDDESWIRVTKIGKGP